MTANIKERRIRILLALYLLGQNKAHSLFETKLRKFISLPSNSPRSRGTIRQMLQDSVIRKEEEGKYQLTIDGIKELSLSFPYIRFLNEKWDGKFRIVSYEIPEKKRKLRDSLRRSVSGWGLGPWHRSFWITAHPVIEELQRLIKNTAWEEYVQAFEGDHLVGNEKIMIEKVWNLSSLELKYKELFKKWHSLLSNQSLTKEDKFQDVSNAFIEVLKIDPGLPSELIGKKWIGFEAWTLFNEMKKILF